MITVNRVEETDLVRLSSLYEELANKKTDLQRLKENFNLINSNPDYFLMGVKDNGILVGSLLAIICHDAAGECRPFMVLENVIVKSDYRGLGIGKRMINYIEEYAREKECFYIFFVSSADRKDAHKFYQSLGYNMDAVKGFKKYL